MKLIRLTRVLGNGMHPTSVVVINPMHVVAMSPRRGVDGYGQPQGGDYECRPGVDGWQLKAGAR